MRKPVFGVSDQVRHKPGCTVTEDELRLEISDLGNRGLGLYYTCSENKGADQLRSHCATDLHLCFRMCNKPIFSQRGSYLVYSKRFLSMEIFMYMYISDFFQTPHKPRHAKTYFSCAKLKAQISCAVTAQLISPFVFI